MYFGVIWISIMMKYKFYTFIYPPLDMPKAFCYYNFIAKKF